MGRKPGTVTSFQELFDTPSISLPGGLSGNNGNNGNNGTNTRSREMSMSLSPSCLGRDPQELRTWSQRSTRSSRSFVRLDLTERRASELSGMNMKMAMSSVPLGPLGGRTGKELNEHYVHRQWCGCFTSFRRVSAKGVIDNDLEETFASSKYQLVHIAFLWMSFLMLLQTFLYIPNAVEDIIDFGDWLRMILILVVIAPTYVTCGILPWQFTDLYLNASGTMLEKGLIALMCCCSVAVCIVSLDTQGEDGYVGLLCLHVTYMHNFTPLKAGTTFLVTTAFTLPLYVLLRTFTFTDLLGRERTWRHGDDKDEDIWACGRTSDDASFLLDLVVMSFMIFYQGLVIVTRDAYMREDLLNRERVHSQRKELKYAKQRCEELLTSMLPTQIIQALKDNNTIEPQLFEDVTVIFVEICNFGELCLDLTPKMIVEVLNIVYSELDQLSDKLHVYKVETVMQVYMAVVGCPNVIINHADIAAHFALSAQMCMVLVRRKMASVFTRLQEEACNQVLSTRAAPPSRAEVGPDGVIRSQVLGDINIQIRIGLNSGRIRAGVVGLDKPRYKLFGDTVNTASRMESTSKPGKVQVSKSTWSKLSHDTFLLEDRGEIPVKGKGTMHTAFLVGYAGQDLENPFQEAREIEVIWGETRNQSDEEVFCGRTSTMNTTMRVAPNIHRDATQRMHDVVSAGFMPSACLTLENLPDVMAVKSYNPPWRDWKQVLLRCWKHLELSSLLVPRDEKSHPRWMDKLKEDLPEYLEDTLAERVSTARKLALLWQLTLVTLSVLDYILELLGEHPDEYLSALLLRTLGNNAVGIVYIILLNEMDVIKDHIMKITFCMWLLQGATLQVCGIMVYHNEPALVIMFIGYILFDKICTLSMRIGVCACMVCIYTIAELTRCSDGTSLMHIGFLLFFFVLMSFAVRLEEHHEHVANYERRRVERRVRDITQAKAGSAKLLLHLLPAHVIDLVTQGISPIAEDHHDVTIIFTDIKGYTAYSATLTPHELVEFLNGMYSAFDEMILKWGLHKVEIIGDAYFISAGCPVPEKEKDRVSADEYAMRAVELALALQRTLPSVVDDAAVQMRVGIHTGSVIAGVVGRKGPRYQLFGPSVSYANEMESKGLPGRVHISDKTHQWLVEGGHAYEFEERKVDIDGEDEPHRTWFVNKSKSAKAREMQKKQLVRRRSQLQDG